MGYTSKVADIVGQMNNVLDGIKLTIERDIGDIHLDDSTSYKSRIQYSNKIIGPFGIIKDGTRDPDAQVLLNVTKYEPTEEDSSHRYVVQVLVQDRTDGVFLNGRVYEGIQPTYRLEV